MWINIGTYYRNCFMKVWMPQQSQNIVEVIRKKTEKSMMSFSLSLIIWKTKQSQTVDLSVAVWRPGFLVFKESRSWLHQLKKKKLFLLQRFCFTCVLREFFMTTHVCEGGSFSLSLLGVTLTFFRKILKQTQE